MTGYCVKGEHNDCPDTTNDSGMCECPCHLLLSPEREQWIEGNGPDRATLLLDYWLKKQETKDPVDWDKVHDGEATENDMLRWAEGCEGVEI